MTIGNCKQLLVASLVCCVGAGAQASTVMFDFGDENDTKPDDHIQAGWTPFEVDSTANTVTSVPDAVEGWTVTLTAPGGEGTIGGRDRDPYAAVNGGTFTLDHVYIDFIVSFEKMSINNLDPTKTYDIQIIMFDNKSGDGRTQTVFNTTGGGNVNMGTIAGPGSGGSALVSDLDFSIFGTGLASDGSGDLEFTFTNSATTDKAVVNGVIITEVVPEPSSLALIGLGGLAMLRRRRKG